MFNFSGPLNYRSDYRSFNILGRKKMRELFLAFMIVFRTCNYNRITFAFGIISYTGSNRSIEWVVEILDNNTDGFFLIPIFQIPCNPFGTEVEFFHYRQDMVSCRRFYTTFCVYYCGYCSLWNTSMFRDIINCNLFHLFSGTKRIPYY